MREGFITREEAIALVKKYDNEFPIKYFNEFLDFTGITEDDFWKIANKWRNESIWIKKNEKVLKKGEEFQKKTILS